MQKTGVAELPLHPGACPPWLFARMKALGKAVSEAIVFEHGERVFLERIADPFFFQSLGCVLGFDWNSSGVTTTVCGALKEGLKESDCGIRVMGGKGAASRKTPSEIAGFCEKNNLTESKTNALVKASRLSAKVDSAAVQDGYALYHHAFFASDKGDWAVVQQGMSEQTRLARRYHWLSFRIESFVNEPHSAVCCEARGGETLNMVACESEGSRKASLELVRDERTVRSLSSQRTLTDFDELRLPFRHFIPLRNYEGLANALEFQPKNYEEMLLVKGMGPKTVRALALLGEIVYGKKPSWRDPARFSFAFGGKDNIPRPLDRECMDGATQTLRDAVEQAKIGRFEKLQALRRLRVFL